MIVILNSCASEFENRYGNTSKLDQDRRYCKAAAERLPQYIFVEILLCALQTKLQESYNLYHRTMVFMTNVCTNKAIRQNKIV